MNVAVPLKHDPARWTLDYYRAFYESRPHGERWQLIDGIPYMMTPPTVDHQIVAMNLALLLNETFARLHPTWMALGPLGVTSPGVDHYQPEPDVSVIDTDTDEVRYVQRAILVAEVVSPTNRMSLIKKKVGFYRTLQLCRAVIVVEPKRIEAKVHVRSDAWAERVLPGAEARLALPEFGVDFPLSALYARTSLARRSGQATS
jgi:Uma2 family endonuclease